MLILIWKVNDVLFSVVDVPMLGLPLGLQVHVRASWAPNSQHPRHGGSQHGEPRGLRGPQLLCKPCTQDNRPDQPLMVIVGSKVATSFLPNPATSRVFANSDFDPNQFVVFFHKWQE